MRLKYAASASAMILAGALITGCHHSETTPEPISPTMPATDATPAATALPMTTPPAAKDLTHVLTKDEPLFASEPGANTPPAGMIKAGSKVLVVIPGATYSQVVTDAGASAYVPTDGLSPVGK